jgi:hypothetical protein
MSENLGAALETAAAGGFVFPAIVTWNDATKKLDKRPAISGWREAASTDPNQIKKWWATFPEAVPGIELGRSGLFAVDLDRHSGGADGVANFKAFRGGNPAPQCPTTKTPSGGYHLYFRQPEGERLGNRTGTLPKGVDCRGDGGWTVAPGAVFEQWRWVGDPARLATASLVPHWIVSAIQARKPAEYAVGPSPSGTSKRERIYAEKALTSAANKVAASQRGSRNTELNTAAFCLGTMIGRGWIGAATVEGRLHDAAAACGLVADDSERAVRSTVKSGIEAGLKQPHADLPNRERNPSETAERETARHADPTAWERGTFSAIDLQTMDFPPFAWIVQDILPAEGAALLCSRPKFGKSWLALDLCLGCTADRFVLGTIKPKQGNVLYLALEDSRRRLQRRMTKLLPFGSKAPEQLTFTTEWRRLHEGGLEDIRAWYDHTKAKGGSPILVVVDVLAKVRKPTGRAPQYEADYEALTGITKLANELGIAILVVHHIRKMQADDLMEMVSGTYGVTGAVDTILVMANKPNGTVLDIRGRDAEQAELAIEFEKSSCRWRVLGEAGEIHRSEQQTKILAALRQAGEPLGAADLKQITEIKRDTLGKALYRLANEGTIKRVGRGLYAMPDWQPPPEGPKPHSGKSGKRHQALPDSLPESNHLENTKKTDTSGKSGSSGSLGTPSVAESVEAPEVLPVQTLPELPECPIGLQTSDKTAEFETPKSGNGKSGLPELPDLPDCMRRAPAPSGNGNLAEDLPHGWQATARVLIKEVWRPSLGPAGDDVFEIDPGWRRRTVTAPSSCGGRQ